VSAPRKIHDEAVWRAALFRAIQGRTAVAAWDPGQEQIWAFTSEQAVESAVKIAYLADAAVEAARAERDEADRAESATAVGRTRRRKESM
jgi:hypothetical protein